MSFLKKLFGLGGSAPAAEKPAETQDYKGFKIAATPFKDGGQWQLCGVVSLEENGVTREDVLSGRYELEVATERVPATVFLGALYDPDMSRIRA